MGKGKGANLVLVVVVVTALVAGPLVVGGVYLGYYLGTPSGIPGPILAIALSTVGFLVAVVILMRVIRTLVLRDSASKG